MTGDETAGTGGRGGWRRGGGGRERRGGGGGGWVGGGEGGGGGGGGGGRRGEEVWISSYRSPLSNEASMCVTAVSRSPVVENKILVRTLTRILNELLLRRLCLAKLRFCATT